MSPAKPKNLAASVRQRLANLSQQRGEEFQFILSEYAIERLLYRIGRSKHSERFVLKGAKLFNLWAAQFESRTDLNPKAVCHPVVSRSFGGATLANHRLSASKCSAELTRKSSKESSTPSTGTHWQLSAPTTSS